MDIGTLGDGSIIKIKLGFLASIIAGIMAIVSMFVIMRQDISNTLKRIETLEIMRMSDVKTMQDLQMKTGSIDSNLYYFRRQYEEDQNKYIREKPKY